MRQLGQTDVSVIDVIQNLFPDKQSDFVISINETDVALIKQLPEGADARDLQKIAKQIVEAVTQELGIKVVIGIGTIVPHIRDLARAYKEAGVAIDVGKVFDTEKTVINYENLGIGRLIYQLPHHPVPDVPPGGLQEEPHRRPGPGDPAHHQQVLREQPERVRDRPEALRPPEHPGYRPLEKIKKLTGLDLREFDDAITFKVALMVKKYLISRGIES